MKGQKVPYVCYFFPFVFQSLFTQVLITLFGLFITIIKLNVLR